MFNLKFKNKKYIMAHYFHDNKRFKEIPGSISKQKFKTIVKKNLKKNYIYTFDDSLKSQYHIAMPILNKFRLKGIFFMNTFQFDNTYNYNEISKFFIKKYYKNLNTFTKEFLNILGTNFKFSNMDIKSIKLKSPFYSTDEVKIRIVRLKNNNLYNKTLKKMFKINKFNYKKFQKKIFMNKKEILNLSKKHYVGLHTHSHYFNFDKLDKKKQYKEISKNKQILEKIINKKIDLISYPIGKFNNLTLKILKNMKISYGFLNTIKNEKSNLKIPRLNINKL